jgi:hypothetical protein
MFASHPFTFYIQINGGGGQGEWKVFFPGQGEKPELLTLKQDYYSKILLIKNDS